MSVLERSVMVAAICCRLDAIVSCSRDGLTAVVGDGVGRYQAEFICRGIGAGQTWARLCARVMETCGGGEWQISDLGMVATPPNSAASNARQHTVGALQAQAEGGQRARAGSKAVSCSRRLSRRPHRKHLVAEPASLGERDPGTCRQGYLASLAIGLATQNSALELFPPHAERPTNVDTTPLTPTHPPTRPPTTSRRNGQIRTSKQQKGQPHQVARPRLRPC